MIHKCESCGEHAHVEYLHCPAHPYTPPHVFITGSDIVAECPDCPEDDNIIIAFPLDVERMRGEMDVVVPESGAVQ